MGEGSGPCTHWRGRRLSKVLEVAAGWETEGGGAG
uniref:Uncharacterized protein n=1 Tax=Arundo donax TaxID=35708 RepID=A0A0A9A9W3_ARUDO